MNFFEEAKRAMEDISQEADFFEKAKICPEMAESVMYSPNSSSKFAGNHQNRSGVILRTNIYI